MESNSKKCKKCKMSKKEWKPNIPKPHIFAKYKIIDIIFRFLFRFNILVLIKWSNNKMLVPCYKINLGASNRFNNYMYRARLVYISKWNYRFYSKRYEKYPYIITKK